MQTPIRYDFIISIDIDINDIVVEASRGAEAQSVTKRDWLWVRSPLDEMKYLFRFIVPFFCSGAEAKRGVELRPSISNVSRTQRKSETKRISRMECLLTLDDQVPLSTLLRLQRKVKNTRARK